MKKLTTILGATFLLSVSLFTCGCKFWNKVEKNEVKPATAITQGYDAVQNKIWCVTFQLVWNDFMDKINNGKPILLAGGNPTIATELNRRLYTTDILSDSSYYKKDAPISKKLKRQIEKDLKNKFNETSDLLDLIDWSAKNSYLFYAMLKKDFNFSTPFDKLEADKFANSESKVKYFGINNKSEHKLRKNVDVLFYNSDDDYAVKLVTKEHEDVILYRTNKTDNFETLFAYIMQQEPNAKFGNEDSLKVPDINIDKTISYSELCNKKIKGTNKVISQALQTIKFKMDNKGGTLKSEAALAVMRMSISHEPAKKYHFDNNFVMFLKEENKDKPYFATRIENDEFLVKE